MYYYRITKYNPCNRDENGYYKVDEWTAISDIGRKYNGKTLLYSEYIKYENAYVEAIQLIMKLNNINLLKIYELETHHYNDDLYNEYDYMIKIFHNEMTIRDDDIDKIIRLILREKMWAILECDNIFFAHFSDDYYMHVGSEKELTEDMIEEIYSKGLFVEHQVSPLLIFRCRNFYYQPNLYETEAVIYGRRICECCKEEVNLYIENMYTEEAVNCICLNCVADGLAAKKFKGRFIKEVEKEISDKSKTEELLYRTPPYVNWQGEYWLTCCDDYCAFVGNVGTKELEEMGIADKVFEEYESRNLYKNVRERLEKRGPLAGYLFGCDHCGKYRIWVDSK